MPDGGRPRPDDPRATQILDLARAIMPRSSLRAVLLRVLIDDQELVTAAFGEYGRVLSGSWLVQNPQFGGHAAVEGYLPPRKIAMAVANTFGE